MPHYNNLSIFRTIDLSDNKAISRLIRDIKQFLCASRTEADLSSKMAQLEGNHGMVVRRIITAIRNNQDYPLLRDLMHWFVEQDQLSMKERVREVNKIIEENVFTNPSFHQEEYAQAVADFTKLLRSGYGLASDRQAQKSSKDAQEGGESDSSSRRSSSSYHSCASNLSEVDSKQVHATTGFDYVSDEDFNAREDHEELSLSERFKNTCTIM